MQPQKIQEDFLKTANRFGKMRFHLMFRDLSRRELEMLMVIHRHTQEQPNQEGIFVSHLAKLLKVSPPAVSRMIGGLEEKGYLYRNIDPEDRRNTFVLLTEKGLEEKRKADEEMKRFAIRVIGKMGEEDMQEMLRLWNKLADIMEEELKGEKDV